MKLANIYLPGLVNAAGGNPWLVNAELQHGRPGQIDDLATAFHSAGESAAEADGAFAAARQRFEAAWGRPGGENPVNDSSRVRLATTSLGVQAEQLPLIAADLEAIAAALAEAQRSAGTYMADLEHQLEQIDTEIGCYAESSNAPGLTAAQRSEIDARLTVLDQRAVSATGQTLRQVNHIRDGYAGTLQHAERRLRNDGYDPALAAALDGPPGEPDESDVAIPPPGTDPKAVNDWWTSLSPGQRAELIAEHPADLGNLNGIPVDARNEINRAVLGDDLSRVTDTANRGAVPVADVLADPGRYGLPDAAITIYRNAVRTWEGLLSPGETEDAPDDRPEVLLLAYRPDAFGGDGAATITIGNPDRAANTAVLVKGLGSGVARGASARAEAMDLYDEANRADWDRGTAVVLWMAYDAPDTFYDPGLYEPNMARTGGRALAVDVNALAVTHQGGSSHVTVVGHSYGSTTVADAAAGYGMRADDIVLLGCPGTDLAHSAADFQLPAGGHLYVGAASGDAVDWLGHGAVQTPVGRAGLGPDPAVDGYGSTRFKAEVPGRSANPFHDHLHYFDEGSESLFSIGDVVSGHGDDLQRDGMTARHRGEYRLPGGIDPEVGRPATTGHRHPLPATGAPRPASGPRS
ncbi:MAG TPA: alpha/beta hydrolase [Mycobacterium sp.]|nr:alpha/beta hydrolase [Mycobacterium sp.]